MPEIWTHLRKFRHKPVFAGRDNCYEGATMKIEGQTMGVRAYGDANARSHTGEQMARFVLVHGGFSGAWIWSPLMDRLKADGHVVEAFDLPGDDHTSASEVSLDSYAGRVCEVLAGSSEPAIVVGHSMGGIVATQAAARCPECVAALVYVAAFLPKDGQSLVDLTRLPEGDGEQVLANVVFEGEPPVAVMPPAASRHALYGACTEDVAASAIARQCPQPVSPLPVAVSIPPGALNGINRYYVLCTRDRAIPPPLQRRMIAENTCADVIELETDHTPQLSMTNELAKALHRFATHSSAGAGRLADRKDRAAAGE
jgi:pimeloyl-ACP methyl ester carboxylesterase